ncbi:MAG: hypothetical protein ACYTHM_25300, partial [Planctomycetota bacterium]
KFPESGLKGVTLGRIVKLLQADGRDKAVVEFVDRIPEILERGELPMSNLRELERLVGELKIDAKHLGKMYEKLIKHGPKQWYFREIVSVGLDDREITVTKKNRKRARALYHALTHDGWTRPRERIQHTKDGVRDVSIVFEKQEKLSHRVSRGLERLLAGEKDAAKPDEVTRVVFACR